MRPFNRNVNVKFGNTGKPGVHQKKVVRDEIGDIQLAVKIDTNGFTRVDFGKPVTFIALPSDKAYDFAHLILENVKDKQGGEPVNVTEEKILGALAHALVKLELVDRENANDLAQRMVPYFMVGMAGEEAGTTTPIGEAQP